MERLTYSERAAAQERYLQQLKQNLESLISENQELRREIKSECERRTIAEEKNTRLPELDLIIKEKEAKLFSQQNEISLLRSRIAGNETLIEQERKAFQEKLDVLNSAHQKMSESFKVLSADALKNNTQSFLDLATAKLEKFQEGARGDLQIRQKAIDELIKPIKESLNKFDVKIQDLEKARMSAYVSLNEQVKALITNQNLLQNETANLVKALRMPNVRGRWGEIQLRRVVEMAGMVEHCDFVQQESVSVDEKRLRPDLVIKLPNSKQIVVRLKITFTGIPGIS